MYNIKIPQDECMSDKIKGPERGDEQKKPEKKPEELDDPKTAENKKQEQQFQKDFGARMKEKTLDVSSKQGNVEYRYLCQCNPDGTLTITKINVSEQKEKGTAAPEPFKTTITYTRFYAHKVVGLPEIDKVLGKEEEHDKDSKEKHTGGHHPRYEVETGVMIPKIINTHHEKEQESGVQLIGKKVLLHTDKGFMLVTVPLQMEWGIKAASEHREVSSSTFLTPSIGVGVESGWTPVKGLSLFGGGGLKGSFEYVQFTNATEQRGRLVVDKGSALEFIPSAFVVAGLKTSPFDSPWFLSFTVEPSVTISSHPHFKMPMFVGSGVEF